NLNRARMNGPSVFPRIQREVLHGQSRPGIGWRPSSPEGQARRSVYVHAKRSLALPLLAAFDAPDTDSSCAARHTTTAPTQALARLKGDSPNARARRSAAALRAGAGKNPADQVRLALRRVTQRAPTAAEVKRGVALLSRLRDRHGLTEEEALPAFCL